MSSIFPSESPQWGWAVVCLSCGDKLDACIDFYKKLGFRQHGGEPDKGWCMLRSGVNELHLFDFPKREHEMLNFRGGDIAGVRAAVDALGAPVFKEFGPTSFIVLDPDGRQVFFDYSDAEAAELETGQMLTVPLPEGEGVHDTDMDLGNFSWCLACDDLATTSAFYCALAFVPAGGQPQRGWQILGRPDHVVEYGERADAMHVSLFQGIIPTDMLNFRGGNVAAIATVIEGRGVALGDGVQVSEDGGESLMVLDPCGRPVLFDTTPPERLYSA